MSAIAALVTNGDNSVAPLKGAKAICLTSKPTIAPIKVAEIKEAIKIV